MVRAMDRQDPYFAEVAALIGDPARANILAALLDGRARTAKELAFAAGVSAQTTSGHLAKLTRGRLIDSVAQGRHRYFRLVGPDVATAVEALSVLAADGPARHRPRTPAETTVRAARTCYDHLAGRLGVAIMDGLTGSGFVELAGVGVRVTESGRGFFAAVGVDVDEVARQRRQFARACIDWSERRPHLAGALGAALTTQSLALGWIERLPDSRAVRVTPAGVRALRSRLSIQLAEVQEDARRPAALSA
jgi:DNA-binding transcriptional ArsR family regulator